MMSSIMRMAVQDEIIYRNPCQVKGASQEKSSERPTASIAEVDALAKAMPEHLSIAVLLAAWCQLRRGEILGLRRKDVDLLHGTLSISNTRIFTMNGIAVEKPPKTAAGIRTLAIPSNILPVLASHLDRYVDPSPDAYVVVGEKSGPQRPCVLRRSWNNARRAIGRTDLHLHDLRHSRLTWAAATGVTTAELMHRAGHSSPTVAMRYQHATQDRDKALADALGELATVTQIGARDKRAMKVYPKDV